MKNNEKHIFSHLNTFQVVGMLVMMSCLFAIAQRLSFTEVINVAQHLINPHSIAIILVGGILIGVVTLAGGEAWHALLKADNVMVQHRLALGLFATGVFTGYLPKKFIKMDARRFIVDMFGYPYAMVLNSSVWVVVLNATAGALLTIVFLVLNLPGELKWIFLLAILAVYGVGIHTMSNLIEYIRIRALMIFVIIHSLSIIIPLISIAYISDTPFEKIEVILIASVSMLAWLIGYIIPGVSAGLFVREYVLFILLSPWIPLSQVLLVMLVYRAQFFIGRGFLYGLGVWIQKHDIFNIPSSIEVQRFHIKN